MTVQLASISPRRRGKSAAADALVTEYLARCTRLQPVEPLLLASEADLLATLGREAGRPAATLLAFDSRGETLTSEEFARMLGRLRDEGAQRIVLAIGPADGWSATALGRAQRKLSLGRLTLPHELARVVVAEQIYRALTILAGHPYHCGH